MLISKSEEQKWHNFTAWKMEGLTQCPLAKFLDPDWGGFSRLRRRVDVLARQPV